MTIGAFVSHRCNDYDTADWKPLFEMMLNKYSFHPEYGCCYLSDDFNGNIENNIIAAMRRSNLYIAVITESWSDNDGYPPKEWRWWKELCRSDYHYRSEDFLGFHIDTDRDQVSFFDTMITFRLKTFEDNDEEFDTILIEDDENAFFIQDKYQKMIKGGLERLSQKLVEEMTSRTISIPADRGRQ